MPNPNNLPSSGRQMTVLRAAALSVVLLRIPFAPSAAAADDSPRQSGPSEGIESASERDNLPYRQFIPNATDTDLTLASGANTPHITWDRSNADSSNNRYSSLSQINRGNVGSLQVAWIYHSGDGKGNIQANPVVVDGVMYVPTVGKNIVAVDAENGREIWRFTPPPAASNVRVNGQDLPSNTFYDLAQKKIVQLKTGDKPSQSLVTIGYGPAERGLTYWGGDEANGPRLYFLANGYLIAIQAKSGQLANSFGDHGIAPSSKGAGSSSFLGAVAPAIYKNVIVATNQNLVDGFDVFTGRHLWSYNTLRYPVADDAADNGGNVWGGIAMDTDRGIAFIATGDPHPNFVGVGRIGRDDDTNSVIAMDARTGRVLWRFQEIAHDLWDHDTAAPPLLVTVIHDGRRVDAVAQVTKFGNTLLLDRLSGKPLFPFRLRRAPVSDVPGERTWPYQPDLELPQPFARQVFTADDVTNISPEARDYVQSRVRASVFGWFEPPHVGKTLIYYGVHGGAEWTGASFDPTTGMLYVSANELAWIVSLSKAPPMYRHNAALGETSGEGFFQQYCAVCHGENREGKGMAPSLNGLNKRLSETQALAILKTGRNAMPPAPAMTDAQRTDLLAFLFDRDGAGRRMLQDQATAPPVTYEASGFDKLLDEKGYPGTKPPWGTLNAINLNTGRLAWKVPLGEYDELTRLGIPKTGTENFGGAMATEGGLVFCAGTRDLDIRAFDKETGAELWRYKLPYGGFAPPSTYEVNGRQYVVIPATGGGKLGGEIGDAYVAFALPRN
jgi:quinoprotein glucose dehydrogenase